MWRSFVAGSQLEPSGLFKRACKRLGGSSFSVLHRSSTKRWKQGGTSDWWNVDWYVACTLFASCCSTSFLRHWFVLWCLCIGISLYWHFFVFVFACLAVLQRLHIIWDADLSHDFILNFCNRQCGAQRHLRGLQKTPLGWVWLMVVGDNDKKGW